MGRNQVLEGHLINAFIEEEVKIHGVALSLKLLSEELRNN